VRLRVLTYNIRSGTDMLGRPRLTEQAQVIRRTGADLVLLQEVSSRDQAERLGSLLRLPYVAFGAARRPDTGEFGNALLCRWPLEHIENHAVAAGWPISQARAVLAATMIADGRRIHAVVAHFGLLPGEPELSARVVLSLTASRDGPLIVGGDLNRPLADAACHRWLRGVLVDSATAHGRAAEPTFPAFRPLLRLDYIYVRGLLVRAARVVSSTASDHRPVLAELATPGTA
jgi:endonuclease/exonuclease/phosphatase family metal-dependent hydrolase